MNAAQQDGRDPGRPAARAGFVAAHNGLQPLRKGWWKPLLALAIATPAACSHLVAQHETAMQGLRAFCTAHDFGVTGWVLTPEQVKVADKACMLIGLHFSG